MTIQELHAKSCQLRANSLTSTLILQDKTIAAMHTNLYNPATKA
jgi:hypothetical protein